MAFLSDESLFQKCCKGSKTLLLTPGSLCELVSNQSMFPQYPLIFLYCRGPLKRALNRSMRNQFDKIPSCRATASIGRVRGIRGGCPCLPVFLPVASLRVTQLSRECLNVYSTIGYTTLCSRHASINTISIYSPIKLNFCMHSAPVNLKRLLFRNRD